MKKRLISLTLAVMLVFSFAAMSRASFMVSASSDYANAQLKKDALEVAAIVNRERAANGLSPLRYSAKLSEAALVRAGEIQQSFSHTRPDGTRCFTALAQAGISYRSAGENIAYGQRNPEEVMNAWMNSSGHRANILGNYDYIGIGVAVKNGVYYWTQFFATSDDLSGEIITSVGTGSDSSTTSTTKATAASTTSTTKATAASTTSTTKDTKETAVSPTKPTTAVTTSGCQSDKECRDNCDNQSKDADSLKIKLIKLIVKKIGITQKW